MLHHGRDRLIDRAVVTNVRYAQVNAERLSFADASFDCVTIALWPAQRHDKPAALASMRRVLKPGGQLLILEFSPAGNTALAPL